MPGAARAISTACFTSASRSRPAAGRIWIVISRATSDCHSAAEASTSMTAPVVSEARNVMIATTAISARPAIELRGTIGVSAREKSSRGRAGAINSAVSPIMGLVVDMHPAFVQHEAPRVILIHQRDVVGGDHDRRPRLVELDEQPQQPRPRDHGAGDRGALLLAAGQHRRQRPQPLAEPDPVEQLAHLVPVALLL